MKLYELHMYEIEFKRLKSLRVVGTQYEVNTDASPSSSERKVRSLIKLGL